MEQLFIEEKNLNSKKPTVAFKAKKQVMTTLSWVFSRRNKNQSFYRDKAQKISCSPLCFESGQEACKSSERGWNDSRRASNCGVCSRSPWGEDCFERAQDLPSFLLHFWTILVFLCNIERQLVWFVPFDFSQKIYCSDSIFAFIRTVVTAASWGVPGAILLSDWLGLQDKRW